MANQAQDDFNTSGRGTPNAWSPATSNANWTQTAGTATMQFVLSSSRGQLTGDTSKNVMTLGSKPFYFTDDVCNCTKKTYTTSTIGMVARVVNSTTYYLATFTSGVLTLASVVNGTTTTLGTFSFSETVNKTYAVRLRVSGMTTNTVQAKVWQILNSEPTSFQITVTDSAITLPGLTGVYGQAHASDEVLNYTSFLASDPPSYSTQFGTTPYGINITNNPATDTTGIQMLRDAVNAGYTWVRWILSWKNIETSPGVYDWTIPDGLVSAIVAQAGMNLDFAISAAPTWAKTTPCTGSTYQTMDPAHAAVFCGLLAARYNASSSIGYVQAIEIGNESFEQGYLHCPPGDWAATLMAQCYPAIKAQSPQCIVGSPAFYNNSNLTPWWLGAFYAAGGGSSVDFLSVHYYPCPYGPDDTRTSPDLTFSQMVKLVRATSQQYGFVTEIWITENSWAVVNSSCVVPDEATQSLYYQEVLADSVASNIVAKHFWFDIGSITKNSGPQEQFRQAYLFIQGQTANPPVWNIHLAPVIARRDGTGLVATRRAGQLTAIRRDGIIPVPTSRRDQSIHPTTSRRTATAIKTARRG